eukprot:9150036-Alexandrium_andersonii.AAC.1
MGIDEGRRPDAFLEHVQLDGLDLDPDPCGLSAVGELDEQLFLAQRVLGKPALHGLLGADEGVRQVHRARRRLDR